MTASFPITFAGVLPPADHQAPIISQHDDIGCEVFKPRLAAVFIPRIDALQKPMRGLVYRFGFWFQNLHSSCAFKMAQRKMQNVQNVFADGAS